LAAAIPPAILGVVVISRSRDLRCGEKLPMSG
jgi:hypothetical protein